MTNDGIAPWACVLLGVAKLLVKEECQARLIYALPLRQMSIAVTGIKRTAPFDRNAVAQEPCSEEGSVWLDTSSRTHQRA